MASDNNTTILAIDTLSCERCGRRLFEDRSFALSPGDVLVLRGPNGSGKSSLLRVLAGLLPAADGVIQWHGRDISDEPAPWQRSLAFLGHANAIKAAMTVSENLAFWAAFEGSNSDSGDALDALDLKPLADLPASMLSAGQQRRLGLARLATRLGGCWLMDEPTVTLDANSVAKLRDLIARHRQAGGIAIIATHEDIGVDNARTLILGEVT